MQKKGLKILEVEAGSVAEEIGLLSGDRILTVNGHDIPDELALKFHISEELVEFVIRRQDGTEQYLEADLGDGSDLGITVEDFRTNTCNNACLFCFVDQLPPGVRPSLKVKDDDYRLSFLHGNYVTLTNLSEKELDRIVEQRLSPLYISVHATEPVLRARMLGRKKVDNLDRKLDILTRGGIQIHAQVVLMPGINDESHLRQTVHDLYKMHPGIQSVAVVPLGLSDHGPMKDRLTPVTPAFSRALIKLVMPWQENFRAEIDRTFVYLADEFYIQAGADFPEAGYYDDFAQIEDGIGLVRAFLDSFESELDRRRRRALKLRGTLATGKLFFPTLASCIERFNQKFRSSLQVCAVENRFLGRNITVAGLLGGQDLVESLMDKDLGSFLIIPQEALSRVDSIFLDDWTPDDVSRQLGKPIFPGGRTVPDLFRLLFRLGRQSGAADR